MTEWLGRPVYNEETGWAISKPNSSIAHSATGFFFTFLACPIVREISYRWRIGSCCKAMNPGAGSTLLVALTCQDSEHMVVMVLWSVSWHSSKMREVRVNDDSFSQYEYVLFIPPHDISCKVDPNVVWRREGCLRLELYREGWAIVAWGSDIVNGPNCTNAINVVVEQPLQLVFCRMLEFEMKSN